MSLRLHFASLSFGAAVDQQTGSLSVFDVIEEIRTPTVPINLQSMVLAATVEKTTPEAFMGKVNIQIFTPDGKSATVGQGDVQIPAEQKRMRALFRFGGFPLHQFGQHRFLLTWIQNDPMAGAKGAGNKIGETILDFDVLQVNQSGQVQPPTSGEKPPITH